MMNEMRTYFQEGSIVFNPSEARHKFLIKNFFVMLDEKTDFFTRFCAEDTRTSKGKYNGYVLVGKSITFWRSVHPASQFYENGATLSLDNLHLITDGMMKVFEKEKVARRIRKKNATSSSSSKTSWEVEFDRFKKEAGTVADLNWFNTNINNQFKISMLRVADYGSLKELLVHYCHVMDINPAECVRNAPFNSMQHTLSYLLIPFKNKTESIQDIPSWTNKKSRGQASVHFSKKIVQEHCKKSNQRLTELMDSARNLILPELRELREKKTQVSKEETSRIVRDNMKFDEFTSNKNGTNPAGGTIRKSLSFHPTPFRKNYSDGMSVTVGEGEKEELYSYTLAFVKPFEWRAELMTEEIAEFKVCVWKAVWNHLSPLSKLMPPNGIQTLLYLNSMGGHINPHRDMSPNMRVDPDQNSQIIGSSVIVVSFYASQYFKFGVGIPGENKFDYPPMLQFLTENGSI
jgi:hypothetical protein